MENYQKLTITLNIHVNLIIGLSLGSMETDRVVGETMF